MGMKNVRRCSPQLVTALVFFLTAGWSHAQDETYKAGEIIERINCSNAEEFSYSLYLPKTYDSSKPHPLMLIFEPASRAMIPIEKMQLAADTYGYVLACSWNTANFAGFRENLKAAREMWKDVVNRFNIDPKRTYTSGFSGGSRLASEIGFMTGTTAGHIACGASFRDSSHSKKNLPFAVALVIGNTDMNYMEMSDVDRKLGFTNTSFRFFEFEAGHEWPPPELLLKVFSWFEVEAMRTQIMPIDKAFLKKQWDGEIAQGNALLAAKRWVDAQRHYQRLSKYYDGLINADFTKDRANQLRKKSEYKAALQRKTRLENAEKMRQRRYVKDLQEQGSTLPEDLAEFPKLIRPWIQEKQRQDGHIKRTQNQDERLMAERLNDFLWRMCSERAYRLFTKGSYREALFLYMLISVYVPEYPFSFIQTAKCYAQLDAFNEALIFLERGLKLGVPNPQKLAEDPNFIKILGLPKFQELVGL